MSDFWIVIIVCLFFVIGGAIPLIRDRGHSRTPLPPRKETLRDWRHEPRPKASEDALHDWRSKPRDGE